MSAVTCRHIATVDALAYCFAVGRITRGELSVGRMPAAIDYASESIAEPTVH
jgi:hypothetical protein